PTPLFGINGCGASQSGIQCTAARLLAAFKSSLSLARVSTGLSRMAPLAGSSIASDGGEQPGSVPKERPGQEGLNERTSFKYLVDERTMAEIHEQELLDSLTDDLAHREVSFSEDQLTQFDSFSARYRRADFPPGHKPPSNGVSHDRWIQRLEAWLEPLSTNPAALEERVALF
ncbi:unnamed protein product, partial [Polarella glacialis]